MKWTKDSGIYAVELVKQLSVLLSDQAEWASSGRIDLNALRNVHDQCALHMHGLYLETISEYHSIAARRGVGLDASSSTVLAQMSERLELLKSYPNEFDAGSMTQWLNSISNCDVLAHDFRMCRNLGEWAATLISNGFQLSTSSGTGGQISIVPRDAVTSTLAGLFSDCVLKGELRRRDFALADSRCLAFSAQNHTAGMSQFCRYLDEQSKGVSYAYEEIGDAAKINHFEVARFFANATKDQAPLLILATAERLRGCIHEINVGQIDLPVIVVLGGGWMTRDGRCIDQSALYTDIEDRFKIGQDRIIESYSLAECCAIFYRCEQDRFHIPPQVRPQVLTHQGDMISVGTGRFAFSDPVNMTSNGFLITDDLIELREDDCKCGRQGWSIAGPIRRWIPLGATPRS